MKNSLPRIAIIGAGSRGSMFGDLISQSGLGKIMAVAEPRTEYREAFALRHSISPEHVFSSWQDLYGKSSDYDAAVVATMDQEHVGAALTSLHAKQHLLLEKPMATNLADCEKIAVAAAKADVITSVCHSLRYGAPFRKLKELVASGQLGQIATVDQLEQVSWYHQAHSFVRGNWRNEAQSTFMLLAKSCHDVDFLSYLVGKPCRSVGSFGALTYFRPEHAPVNSGDRCVDCLAEPNCTYSALRHYVDTERTAWPANNISFDHSREAHLQAITDGPYGRCVWKTDNDVVDHQVVIFQFGSDAEPPATATLTMTGFTQQGGRRIRVHGTEAEAELTNSTIEIRRFSEDITERISIPVEKDFHGGGDRRVVNSWLRAIHNDDKNLVVSSVAESLQTHRIVFAAEKARLQNRIIEL